jgi:hypothetical protein
MECTKIVIEPQKKIKNSKAIENWKLLAKAS